MQIAWNKQWIAEKRTFYCFWITWFDFIEKNGYRRITVETGWQSNPCRGGLISKK